MTAPRQEASKLGQFSWALFDWANQPFFTVVTTFIFAPYFANVMVGNAIEGQAAWAFTQSTSGILIALMSPFLGAMADAGGHRKPYIFAFQLLLGLGCAALWWAYPGRPDLIGPISAAVVIATVGAEMSIVFNNAQLPHIVRPERMGWLSGFGWGLGYCGGLIALFMVLAVNDRPLFGLDPKTYTLERLVGPASALWLAVFVIPMFLFTPDMASQKLTLWQAARQGGRSLLDTLKKIERPFFTPIYDFCSPRMVFGRIILLGDAASSARPHMGFGVAKAGDDARALADALAAHDDVDRALAHYQSVRAPISERIMRHGRKLGTHLGVDLATDEDRATWKMLQDYRAMMDWIAVPNFLAAS